MLPTVSLNPHIRTITFLRKQPNSDTAKSILEDVTKSISYLMKENKLKVGTLCEFYPKQANLLGLNVNRGQKIMLRLRHPQNSNSFLPRDEIMHTMIHELTHNLYGPHDDTFNKKMKEWCGRQYVIETLGLVDNFLGTGKKLGGSKPQKNAYYVRMQRLKLMDRDKISKGNRFTRPGEMAAKAALSRVLDNGIIRNRSTINNNTDEGVNVDDIMMKHNLMDSQSEEVIVIDDEEVKLDNTEKTSKDDLGSKSRNTSKSKDEIEIIDLT